MTDDRVKLSRREKLFVLRRRSSNFISLKINSSLMDAASSSGERSTDQLICIIISTAISLLVYQEERQCFLFASDVETEPLSERTRGEKQKILPAAL